LVVFDLLRIVSILKDIGSKHPVTTVEAIKAEARIEEEAKAEIRTVSLRLMLLLLLLLVVVVW